MKTTLKFHWITLIVLSVFLTGTFVLSDASAIYYTVYVDKGGRHCPIDSWCTIGHPYVKQGILQGDAVHWQTTQFEEELHIRGDSTFEGNPIDGIVKTSPGYLLQFDKIGTWYYTVDNHPELSGFVKVVLPPPFELQVLKKFVGDRIPYIQYSWSDFRGTPFFMTDQVTGEEKIFASVTIWNVDRKWTVTQIDSPTCEYQFTSVDAIVSLVSSKAFVKQGSESTNLLSHEQGHMDIAEIHARAFEKELLNKTFSCPSATYDVGMIKKVADDLFQKIKNEIIVMSALYDTQTKHNSDRQVQADWKEKIQCMLNNNGPSEHCLSLKGTISTTETKTLQDVTPIPTTPRDIPIKLTPIIPKQTPTPIPAIPKAESSIDDIVDSRCPEGYIYLGEFDVCAETAAHREKERTERIGEVIDNPNFVMNMVGNCQEPILKYTDSGFSILWEDGKKFEGLTIVHPEKHSTSNLRVYCDTSSVSFSTYSRGGIMSVHPVTFEIVKSANSLQDMSVKINGKSVETFSPKSSTLSTPGISFDTLGSGEPLKQTIKISNLFMMPEPLPKTGIEEPNAQEKIFGNCPEPTISNWLSGYFIKWVEDNDGEKNVNGIRLGYRDGISSFNLDFDGKMTNLHIDCVTKTLTVDLEGSGTKDIIGELYIMKNSEKNSIKANLAAKSMSITSDGKDINYQIFKSTNSRDSTEFNFLVMPGAKTLTISNLSLIPESLQKTESTVDSTPREKVPNWVKQNAKWWAEGAIDDNSFKDGIQYMIKEDIISIKDLPKASDVSEDKIPSWVKQNAKWWAEGAIEEVDFVNGLKYMVEKGIIRVSIEESTSSAPTSATVKIPDLQTFQRVNCVEENSCFIPFEVQIAVGGTVTWVNEGLVLHTIASGNPNTGRTGEFESGFIKRDLPFEHTFDTAGEYPYYCITHWEKGIVIVK